MTPDPLRAIVVEDERLVRQELVRQLAALPGVELHGEASDLSGARELIRHGAPHVMFLDIELVDGCGFELMAAAPRGLHTIVVSAYEAYALRAFEVSAVDYLLKPVQPERLRAAVARVRAAGISPAPKADSCSDAPLAYDACVFLTLSDGTATFLPVDRIVAVTAEGDYTCVRSVDGQTHLVLKSLRQWQARLPAQAFMRIHRSTLVNVRRVTRIDAWLDRRYRVQVEGLPRPLTMSRRHALELKRRFA